MKNKKIIVVQNTHWDYEWYFTNGESSVLFEFFMKELFFALENNKIDYFIIDGQMGIIEKYLESFPEDIEKFIKYNKMGKISIGPWFTQTDQMIISGESIVRNLLLGHKIGSPLGGVWKMGYVPDAFGQSQNMPKIYNGFNIDKMIFWRGLSDSKYTNKEFIWKSGESSVNSLNMPEGYYSGGGIYWASANELKKSLLLLSNNSKIFNTNVLSLGGDQRYVDLDIKEKITTLNNDMKEEYEFILGNYEDYFSNFKNIDLDIVEGEFLDSQDSKIHRSIYSHRYDHKYLNNMSEVLLTNVLEPLQAIANGAGIENHFKIIENAWRLLLLNSAHDSSGGCNSDITNEHILNRFKKCIEIITSYIDIIIRKISETVYKKNDLVLFNTSSHNKETWKNISVITKKMNFILDDNEILYDKISQEKIYFGSINENPKDNNDDFYFYKTLISFNKEISALSFASISINEVDNKIKNIPFKDNYIENDSIKISIIENRISVFDKKNNTWIENFIEIVSDCDAGDTYDFSPLINSKRVISKIFIENFKVFKGRISEKIVFEFNLKINKDIESWRMNGDKQKQKFSVEISIDNGTSLISFHIKTKNMNKDHRLRIRLNSNVNFDKVHSDTQFGFITRPIVQKEILTWKKLGWKEEPTGIYPVLSNIYVKSDNNQMTIFLNGIKEYEAFDDNKIEITLYRSVGFLGKPNLIRRPGKASGQEYKYVPTPDSQLINRELEWNFAISFTKMTESTIRKNQFDFVTKNTYYQNQELDRFTGPLKYFVSNKWTMNKIKTDFQLLQGLKINKNIEVSIVKQISEKEILIRFINHGDDMVENPILFEDENIIEIYTSNLLEEKKKTINRHMSSPGLRQKPGEIKTIIIERK